MKKAKFKAIAAAAVLGLGLCGAAWSQAPSPEEMQRAKEFMQKSKAMMKPELREKADALPPEIQQFLFKVAVKHTRRSETLPWMARRFSANTMMRIPPKAAFSVRTIGTDVAP